MMDAKKRIKVIIKKMLDECMSEERVPNSEADELVDKKQNFVGSHTYGENLGGLDKMYVAYSYGEQHPLYIWLDKEEFKKLRPNESKHLKEDDYDGESFVHFCHNDIKESINLDSENDGDIENKKGVWFYNEKPYYVKNKKGKLRPNRWTKKHLVNLKPNEKVQARDKSYLLRLIDDFKNKYNIGDNEHTDYEPGDKK